ncbi:hypothetical protein V6N12_014288 [Hibiscus sabdariffa]|uniref:Reverse transcriptase zinc-binding domain-containing protein n=1 Tax=Hibiscus sabdariffa TaxID=183260 RepID=A0ABR2DJR4_9ROSI
MMPACHTLVAAMVTSDGGVAQGGESQSWKTISKYRGLPRVHMLLWLILKGRILTNSERFRRHFSNESCCGLCGAVEEDLSHVFRDFFEARMVWSRVVKKDKLDEFLSLEFQNWLIINIKHPQLYPINSGNWDVVFDTLFWNNWVNRSYRLFSLDLVSSKGIYQRSMRMVAELDCASFVLRQNQRTPTLPGLSVARWETPLAGWIKVNTDGSRNAGSGLASCGGVGSDSESRWCFGFAKGIGSCSCFEAELWGCV